MSNDAVARICPGCGARINPDASRCDLCGLEVGISEAEILDEPEQFDAPEEPSRSEATVAAGKAPDPSACAACGRKNRPDARFCDQCATPLATSLASAKRSKPSADTGKLKTSKKTKKKQKKKKTAPVTPSQVETAAKPRVGLLIVAGVVVVAILYWITVMSKSSPPAPNPAPAVAQQVDADLGSYLPEDDGLAQQSQSILTSANEATDPARKIALLEQLVEVYASNGRLDLAGREQERIAEDQNTASSWALAGNLHFDWMEQQSGAERVKSAQRSSAAYEKALEIDPANLDVRTDLGVAYLNDPANPMAALRETNSVLETDSNHVQANFNKGVMLVQIGRTDDALRHFQRVTELTEPGTAAYDRAVDILAQLQTAP